MNHTYNHRSLLLLGVCGTGAVAAAAVMAMGANEAIGAGLVLFLSLVYWLGGVLLMRNCFSEKIHLLASSVVLFMALALRVILFDNESPDYTSFLSVWTNTMRGMTVKDALVTPIGDYNMPYLYLLLLFSRLPVSDLYCIKLFSVLADVFCALALLRLTTLVSQKDTVRLAVFTAALAVPTAFLNGAYWGQCDSVYSAFALWGLYLGLRRRPLWALALFALGFSFKLQTVFLLPVVAVLLAAGYMDFKHLPMFPAVFLGASLPALVAGRSFSDTFSIYLSQTEAYPYMSLNAPSFWIMVPNEYFWDMAPAPVLLAGIAAVVLLFIFLKYTDRLEPSDLISMGFIFSLCVPWLLPKMHERYFYLAEMLCLVYGAKYPRRIWTALALQIGGFLSYRNYLYGGVLVIRNEHMSLVYGLVLLLLILWTYRELEERPVPAYNLQ